MIGSMTGAMIGSVVPAGTDHPESWWKGSRWPAVLGLLALWGVGGALARLVGIDPMLEVHLLYVPVVLTALRFGVTGGVLMALLAAVSAAGVDATWTGETPPDTTALLASLAHGLGFVIVGVIVGLAVRAQRALHQRDLTSWWDQELAESRRDDDPVLLSDEVVRHAVETRDFYPIFQPIYRLEDGWLFAVEALTRFDSDPPVPPSRWFARAAELGIGVELEIAAVEKSIASSHRFPERVMVSVNTSAAAIMEADLLRVIEQAPRPVMLELTELEPVSDYRRMGEMLQRYRQAGARIAVDNVGASMTSLRHIARLVPDVIKLDRVLTNDARSDPVRWALTRRLLHYARTSGAQLVVEGIEEPDDLSHWRGLGVHAAQGYLLGRPGQRTIVERFDFPTTLKRRGGPSRRARGAAGAQHPRDNVVFEDQLAASQLGDEPSTPRRPETVVDPLRKHPGD